MGRGNPELYNPDFDVFEEPEPDDEAIRKQLQQMREQSATNKVELGKPEHDAIRYVLYDLQYILALQEIEANREMFRNPREFSNYEITNAIADGLVNTAAIAIKPYLMRQLAEGHGFIIGGRSGKFTTLSPHAYDKAVHTPVLLRNNEMYPKQNALILTGFPEIGVNNDDGSYRTLVSPFFMRPNMTYPGAEVYELLDTIMPGGVLISAEDTQAFQSQK